MKLVASALTVRFRQATLFNIPELRLERGDSVWLRGRNGAGKTTLLKILSGLDKPSSGYLMLDDHPVKPGQLVYLHQSPYLFEGSVRFNIAFGLKGTKLSSEEKAERIEQALRLAELDTLADSSAQVLSGGERQRLALARAWVLNPDCLLLDEPSANLDPHSIDCLAAMVKQLQQQGCALILTSHQQNALTDLCQTTWWLQDKALVKGSLQEACA